MSKRTPSSCPTSTVTWESLEEFARLKIQMWFQELLEQEVTELLGREHHERQRAIDGVRGYRNGYGKPRRLSMQGGTITVRRPRVRELEERFESRQTAGRSADSDYWTASGAAAVPALLR